MPLFTSPFSPKKTPPRKYASMSSLHTLDRSTREIELGLECGPPVMNLGGQVWKFKGGQWITESGGNATCREMQRLKKRILQLEDENNYLKVKIETLMDMLTESKIEYHLMEKELEKKKPQRRRKN